ncbi:hypothetical protein ABIB94_009307, partial [Bradyrhizobium sp. JR7.2]|uniref:hypothetical protein n=1 Tax=unclassified Bradyrhizobium TaxID=2631580 RepID=UPI00339408CB
FVGEVDLHAVAVELDFVNPSLAGWHAVGRGGVRSDRLGAVRRALSSLVSRSRVHHKDLPVHAGGFLSLTLNAAEGRQFIGRTIPLLGGGASWTV